MDELDIVRGLMLRTAGTLPATAPLAKALLEWAQPHGAWLMPAAGESHGWDALLAGLRGPRGSCATGPRRMRPNWSNG